MVTGPDFVGCTTLLRGLERVGYQVYVPCPKPTASQRTAWLQPYFTALVQGWTDMPTHEEALLIEDSPWAYLTKHATHLPPDHRATCRSELAALQLPHLTIVLHTSGRAVGLRHPLFRGTPEDYSPVALAHM